MDRWSILGPCKRDWIVAGSRWTRYNGFALIHCADLVDHSMHWQRHLHLWSEPVVWVEMQIYNVGWTPSWYLPLYPSSSCSCSCSSLLSWSPDVASFWSESGGSLKKREKYRRKVTTFSGCTHSKPHRFAPQPEPQKKKKKKKKGLILLQYLDSARWPVLGGLKKKKGVNNKKGTGGVCKSGGWGMKIVNKIKNVRIFL